MDEPKPYDDSAELHAEWLATQKAARLRQWRNRMPGAMRTPGDLDPRVADWTAGLVRGAATNLLLVGDVGVGKTWSCWRAIDDAYEAGWQGDAALYGAYEWRRLTTPPVDTRELEDAAKASLLVLDDPGAMRLGAWELEHLYGVIDRRWNDHHPTVITSNVPDLRSMLGERIASRIAADRVVVVLEGTDRRREGK